MSDKSAHAKKRRPGCLAGLFLWPFRGRWWVKTLKLTLVAVILYNVIAFIFMWCPPVRGVVVDIDTGKPIQGAIVQKSASGPFLIYSEGPSGARTGGADAQMVTGPDGRFSFPGAFAHPTRKDTAAFDVYWPFQWLDSIDLSVWQRDYIGASSFKIGMWWFRESPERSEGYCRVERYRIPFLGYRYRILLKKPATEAEWQVKIGSVDLGGGVKRDEQEQQRLFDDLTGYLERWPHGDHAAGYFSSLLPTAMLASCDYTREQYLSGRWTAEDLRTSIKRMKAILSLSKTVNRSGVEALTKKLEDADIREIPEEIECRQSLLNNPADSKGNTLKETRKVGSGL